MSPKGGRNWLKAKARGKKAHAEWMRTLRSTSAVSGAAVEFERVIKRELQKDWEKSSEVPGRQADCDAQRGADGDECDCEGGAGVVCGAAEPDQLDEDDLQGSPASTWTDRRNVFFGSARVRHDGDGERHGVARWIIPFGSTFFVFSDYCRPALRMAA